MSALLSYEDKILLNAVKLRKTSIFAHNMDSVTRSLRIVFSNAGTNGSFLIYATEISCFYANFEDNHRPVLWNYGTIKHHSAEGNCHNDFMIQNDGRP